MANAADRRRRHGRVIHVMRRRPQMAERVHFARCVLLLHRRDEMGAAALVGWLVGGLSGSKDNECCHLSEKERKGGRKKGQKL